MLTPAYNDVIRTALTNGRYAELVHLFALSAALGITTQSYCYPKPYMGSNLHHFTMTIDGNSFKHGMASGHIVMCYVDEHENQSIRTKSFCSDGPAFTRS